MNAAKGVWQSSAARPKETFSSRNNSSASNRTTSSEKSATLGLATLSSSVGTSIFTVSIVFTLAHLGQFVIRFWPGQVLRRSSSRFHDLYLNGRADQALA